MRRTLLLALALCALVFAAPSDFLDGCIARAQAAGGGRGGGTDNPSAYSYMATVLGPAGKAQILGPVSIDGGLILASFSTTPMDLYVSPAGSGVACSQAVPCAPQTACNEVPLFVTSRITVHAAAGVYSAGFCVLEGRTVLSGQTDGGAYVDFVGSPGLSTASPNAGTVTSSNQPTIDTINTPASLTVSTGGGWADGGLFGLMVSMNTGASAGQVRAIDGNTGSTIYVGGTWGQSQPASGDTFTIIDPCRNGTFFDGGIILNPQTPSLIDNPNIPAEAQNQALPGQSVFLFANNASSQSLPAGYWGANSPSGGIRVRLMCAQNFFGELVTARHSPGVWVASNSMANLVPPSGSYVTTDSPISVDWNYLLDVSADSLLGVVTQPSINSAVDFEGNVANQADMIEGAGLPYTLGAQGGNGGLVGKGMLSLFSNLNYSLNALQGPVWALGACMDCNILGDVAVGVNDALYGSPNGGGFGLSIGCGEDGQNCLGDSPSSIRIYGGKYTSAATDCAAGCGGIQVANAMIDLHGGSANPTNGTSTASASVGLSFVRNAFVVVNGPGGATLTGQAGDTNFAGTNVSWSSIPNPGRIVDQSSLSYVQEGIVYGGSRTSLTQWGSNEVVTTLTVDAGTPITSSVQGTISATAPTSQGCGDTAGSITGAIVGAECSVGPPSTVDSNTSWSCYVSAGGTVKLHLCCTTATCSTSSRSYSVRTIGP